MSEAAAGVILDFNSDREPERLAMKYEAMAADPFPFLRGTCRLFHQRMIEQNLATGGPPAWICGDLHLENFGTYLGDNNLAYFDINDFDEAALAPCSWDILRLATSLIIAGPSLKLKDTYCGELATHLTETWRTEMAGGKPRWIERKTAGGIIGDLMDGLKDRRTAKFLDKRSVAKKGGRKLVVTGGKALPITDSERAELEALSATLGSTPEEQRFFKMIDAARRIAGTGSLGIRRYVVLVEGRRSPDDNAMLDLKQSKPSAVAPYSPCRQPDWESDAHRIAAITSRCQAIAPNFLRSLTYQGAPWVMKELQPTDDRLNLADVAHDLENFADAVVHMGRLAAWAQLRSTGRDGSATADDLIAFAKEPGITQTILHSAREMARITMDDYSGYAAAYAAGAVPHPIKASKPKKAA